MCARALFWIAALVVSLVGCRGVDPDGSVGGVVNLNGAGATFPFPLYSKWTFEYYRQHPTVKINYQSIGSGGGIRQLLAETVDFGATDAPMTADERRKAPRTIHHIPATLGAVAVAYNLPSVPTLRLSSETLSAIYLGEITSWNDPRIAEVNPGIALPEQGITVVYRSDGSGTTAVFSDYLAKVSPRWKEQVGAGKSLRWPKGLGAKGNEGVSGQVKTTAGAIGYLELAYVHTAKLQVVALKNRSGEFITPSVKAVTAAASGVKLPESLTTSITDSASPGAYPIASYSYLLVYEDHPKSAKAAALASFLLWSLRDGQRFAEKLHYAPLPEEVVTQVEARVKQLTTGGKPALP
ncbi:MAG: phosphate ABC transporter substrate-binding protein PstS [Polyangiaceae bacterium]|nr:phosphate ABC transporter substrate-binding protein PstS [Polyangiaceae bacterium]